MYTIYERLLKAKQLVQQKVEEDLRGRPELLSKIDEYTKERFEVFIGGVLSTMSGSFDSNKYEDFARIVLGGRAYLLFSFDKLIISVNCILLYFIDNQITTQLFK